MAIDKKIIECEMEYTKCFSEFYEDENIIRFRDDQLRDMYNHNYTYIKKEIDDSMMVDIIGKEIELKLSQKSDFCNIILSPDISGWNMTGLEYKSSVSVHGFYNFNLSYLSSIKSLPDCEIKRVNSQEMIEELLYCDLQHDEKTLGLDFCERRCFRRGRVYISDTGVNSYLCYHRGEKIGSCDLFIHEGTAKIEDFGVVPKHQRKGYGTTILKAMIEIAVKEGCNTVYLVTDEGDTAKEMYKKNGFTKIGQSTQLFYKL